MNNAKRPGHPIRLGKVIRIVLIVVIALAAITVAAAYAASRVIESRIVGMLGASGHTQRIHVGLSEVVLENVEIGAPPGWPAQQTLRANRVVLHPDWQALLSNRVSISSATVDDYYLSALRTRDGRMRILPTLQDRTGDLAGGADGKDGGAGEKRQTDVGNIVFNNGRLDFYDASISTPPHLIPIEALHAEIGSLHSPATAEQTSVRVQGQMVGKKRRGALNVDGWIAVASLDADVRTTLQGVDVSLLAPYLQKQAPAALVAGQVDLNMRTRIEQQQLNAQGTVALRDLAFDNSGSALLSLPRKAVLAAMEDRHGQVSFDFTLRGDLRDPKFSLNDNISTRLAGGFAKAIGVSVEGVAGGVGAAVKGLGGALNDLIK